MRTPAPPPAAETPTREGASAATSDTGRAPPRTRSAGNFANDAARAAEAGRKGGRMSPTNFKHDPGRAAEAGRKGGRQSPGNFKQDSDRAREAGRKGGRQRASRSA
ncbi:general stress protein [Chromohalobacter salexigens]|uniref:general stress protein n=1 Tax=Chromohalobacter israelensis TaxID=141390 RepID=UPI0032E88759